MKQHPWRPGAATGIGSMPGDDPAEAATIIFGEFPEFPYFPELPARGVGADLFGRTAALLIDLAVEVMPSGYRVTAKPGHDHRRAVDLLRWDLDAVEEARQRVGAPQAFKAQFAGPWTLVAGIELPRGHRVLTDRGAVREFAESMLEGLRSHVRELEKRLDAPIVVQFDEPSLPAVLAGALPTASGYGTVPSVHEPEARELLALVLEETKRITGQPVIVHCCAPRPPIALLRSAGADALAVDATLFDGAPRALLDEIGEALDADVAFLLGLVPTLEPSVPLTLHEAALPALRLVDRLGFPRETLAKQAVPTPTCGLAGATPSWMRKALSLSRDLGKAFVEPPESW
jgi:hypothetical protein